MRMRERACAFACNERVRLRVCSCVCLCPFARARCVRACMRASVSARSVRSIPSDCNSARVCSERLCAPRRCARPPIARRRLAVFIARPAPRVEAARAVAFGSTGFTCRARSAAGVTWTCRTASAQWAARYAHTSVVDAVSGAIYVIGGYGGSIFYDDVWASTDGGARAGLGRGYSSGVIEGVLEWGTRVGYLGVLRSTKGVRGVLRRTKGVRRGTAEY